jgi:fibronectin type 3 domain-containing protein
VEQVAGTGVAQNSHSVYLSWQPGGGHPVGYNIYRSTTQGGPYQMINSGLDASTDYTDDTVVSGTTYFYVATEVNEEGEESAYSNVAKAVIPNS